MVRLLRSLLHLLQMLRLLQLLLLRSPSLKPLFCRTSSLSPKLVSPSPQVAELCHWLGGMRWEKLPWESPWWVSTLESISIGNLLRTGAKLRIEVGRCPVTLIQTRALSETRRRLLNLRWQRASTSPIVLVPSFATTLAFPRTISHD